MATSLLNSTFLIKTPQHLKKFWDAGVRSERFMSRTSKNQPKNSVFGAAKMQIYRSKTAYKLIHFDEKHDLVHPGFKVLDIGAAPGSWSQFLALRTNSNRTDPNGPVGLVVAIDSEKFDDIEGVISLSESDFLDESSQKKILGYLGRRNKFDFICSDMASETGIEVFDRERLMKLAYYVMLFSVKHLNPGGNVLIRVCNATERGSFQNDMKKFFESVNFSVFTARKVKSPETYFVGKNFQGIKGMN